MLEPKNLYNKTIKIKGWHVYCVSKQLGCELFKVIIRYSMHQKLKSIFLFKKTPLPQE